MGFLKMSKKNCLLDYDLNIYDDKPTKCSICLEYINKKTKASCITKCNHIFHIMCIKTWMKKSENCPMCRTKIETYTDRIICLKCKYKSSNTYTCKVCNKTSCLSCYLVCNKCVFCC